MASNRADPPGPEEPTTSDHNDRPQMPQELDKILQRMEPCVQQDLRAASKTLWENFHKRSQDSNIKEFYNVWGKVITESDTGLLKTEEPSPLTDGQLSSGCVTVVPQSPSGKTSRSVVKVFTVTTGETFGADEALMNQVNTCPELQVKRTEQKDCRVLLLFCPITSRLESDVEVALEKVTGDKPVILVLMHHTWKADYSTSGRTWSEAIKHVVLDVHVLFHETVGGLLMCSKNEEAVRKIQEVLLQHSTPYSSGQTGKSSFWPLSWLQRQ
ncbi:uncharacterized protein LOC108882401 isoform X1 [Lates calcarifer]|uniref:Uncharacterized protein LOC108882401 isoform X1 n=1 Tax=Lates calcarifer TaxID=8187 RepID=A0AAJ7LSR8_LATCA|nr:uncharacterized protein LOC108882401 isoform X1 [Lates calcarifer]